jgi:hypothetical protein
MLPNKVAQAKFKAKYFGELLDSANAWLRSNKDANTEKLRDYVNSRMLRVPNGSWLVPDPLQIELDIKARQATQQTTTPPPPVQLPSGMVPIVAPNGKRKLVSADRLDDALKAGATFGMDLSDPADAQALQWLSSNPNRPKAPAVRVKLRAKGLLQ